MHRKKRKLFIEGEIKVKKEANASKNNRKYT